MNLNSLDSPLYLMTPESFKLWCLTDRNFYISIYSDKDFISHFSLEQGRVYSFYTVKNILNEDRDFAELYGIDMESEEAITYGLRRLGIVTSNLEYYEYETKSPNGDDVVVVLVDGDDLCYPYD